MKNLKNQKGITLVALVVTIIVLLILAGVSLRLVAGEQGILKRTENAVNKNSLAALKEQVDLELVDINAEYLEKKYDTAQATPASIVELVKTNKAKIEGLGDGITCEIATDDATATITIEVNGQTATKTITASTNTISDWQQ